MDTITLHLNLKTVPPLMRRGQHALILVRDRAGQFVLGSKDIYPQNICRLVGGGIEADEDPQLGAARELEEELHLHLQPEQLRPLKKVIAEIAHQGEHITFTTWLYFFQVTTETIKADDDLDDICALSETELRDLIQRYSQLQGQRNEAADFEWEDYGALYGPMHQIALDAFHGLT